MKLACEKEEKFFLKYICHGARWPKSLSVYPSSTHLPLQGVTTNTHSVGGPVLRQREEGVPGSDLGGGPTDQRQEEGETRPFIVHG